MQSIKTFQTLAALALTLYGCSNSSFTGSDSAKAPAANPKPAAPKQPTPQPLEAIVKPEPSPTPSCVENSLAKETFYVDAKVQHYGKTGSGNGLAAIQFAKVKLAQGNYLSVSSTPSEILYHTTINGAPSAPSPCPTWLVIHEVDASGVIVKELFKADFEKGYALQKDNSLLYIGVTDTYYPDNAGGCNMAIEVKDKLCTK